MNDDYDWEDYEKELKERAGKNSLEQKVRVHEADFDLVIRDQMAEVQSKLDEEKNLLYNIIEQYAKKEKLKKMGYPLAYYRLPDGTILAEIDQDYYKIKRQRWI